tara:strand:+ start:436 stop:693 length:258 start_codon:yes stop_codon:yes gene_type:complete
MYDLCGNMAIHPKRRVVVIDFDNLTRDSAKWPFCEMSVGEAIEVIDFHGKTKTYIQRMVHNYGNSSSKKFQTKTSGGKLYVKRVA